MSFLDVVLLQTTTPTDGGASPAAAFSLFLLVFASLCGSLLAVVGFFAWALGVIPGPARRKRRRTGAGTWVPVDNGDYWIHFSDHGDAHDGRRPGARTAPRSRQRPSRADLWDEP
ncbi:MAG: hypothetical protein M3R38_19605 [Actinomycetota bacterium]|nr:hypothetical protein [Actinomycetota bacterium]MDP9488214.1 hypothetical protein [Actinomycetota bacterium]